MTPDTLSAAAGILLSLFFSYVPGLSTWYAALVKEKKQLAMLALLALVAGGAFALACAQVLIDLFGVSLACNQAGALALVRAFIVAAIANQTTYRLSPQTQAVKRAALGRLRAG